MGLPKILIACLLFTACYGEEASHIRYYLQRGFTDYAITAYQEYYQEQGQHDSELIQQIAFNIMLEGFNSRDNESQLLSLFGAGISLDERLLGLLERAITSSNPEMQLVALNFLAKLHNDQADEALNRAMASDYLLIRLEAAFHLAKKRYPTVISQTESLLNKVPREILPFFPQLFGMIGNEDAIKILRKLLIHPDPGVRIEAIRSIAVNERDDLLPQLRTQASQHHPVQQEVCAMALGLMKDELSVPRLETLCRSSTPNIRLAALQALYLLGRKEVHVQIEEMAKKLDPFAIYSLHLIPESESLLIKFMQSPNIQIRQNAALALLDHQNPRCLPTLCELLISDYKDLGITKMSSIGRALNSYKIIPSATENFKDDPMAYELSLNLKEQMLIKCADLPEKDFIELATLLFEKNQNELIPTLVHLLEELQTPSALELLKKYQQKAGAPLIRNYCNLALYRLKESGPYLANLKKLVSEKHNLELIRFRPVVSREIADHSATYQLTPEEASRLLVEAFETIAQMQEEESINILLDAIKNGNKKNKYALAGLLIRAAQ